MRMGEQRGDGGEKLRDVGYGGGLLCVSRGFILGFLVAKIEYVGWQMPDGLL